jgi:2-oxoglutarate dehydrogenase E2 component (dihydrolipoamide succinyltransferase)
LSRKRNPFVDGREAVTFLVRVKDVLEDPARLVLDL